MALRGINVVEFAGLAPGPLAGLILADYGASVIRIDKPGNSPITPDILCRGKRSISLDARSPEGKDVIMQLVKRADILIDPFRPGVLESLGLGPDMFLGEQGKNKKLIYGRVVGFDRNGPQRNMAGHDLNYLAQSGVLSMMPPQIPAGNPSFPLNILADMAGGGMSLALGILMALHERGSSGLGQVVENDMVGGTRYLSTFPLIHHNLGQGSMFANEPGHNLLDSGTPIYNTYRCSDGKWIPSFSSTPEYIPSTTAHSDRAQWPALHAFLAQGFLTKTRDEWTHVFHDTDSCAVPVLTPNEAAVAAMNDSTTKMGGPAPHPNLSRTPAIPRPTMPEGQLVLLPGTHTAEILAELGYDTNLHDTNAMPLAKL